MLKKVVLGACMLVVGVTLGALLVGHQRFLKKVHHDALNRARRSVISLLSEEEPSPAGGAVYTIWGRTKCPAGASLVYKGVVGGGHYKNTGGGSEYLCLVEHPKWNKTMPGVNNMSSIKGAEFKSGDKLFDLRNVNGPTLVNQNAVCAVCQTAKPVQVMVPGTDMCMPGWHREYYGYLMSTKWDAITQRNYICMDIAPEADRSGADHEGGSELWPVEAACGYSLPCPKYENGKELTCAVCSRQSCIPS